MRINKPAKILLLILSFIAISSARAQLSMKQYDLQYKNNSTAYMYAGIKGDVRLIGLPYNADYIQVVVVNSKDAPKARIIGQRKIEVLKGNTNQADFTIELDDVDRHTPFSSSLELKIKAFSELNGKYEIVDRISIFIRPIVCNGQDDEVCGLVKTKCHSGNQNCIEREALRNFKSECEAKSVGAEVLHAGSCSQ